MKQLILILAILLAPAAFAGEREPGQRVNLEADILGKYMRKYLERMLPAVAR